MSDDHRARVGRERSARTETRILEAALVVFSQMGPDAPRIDDFVQAAGISRGTFYNHFDSVEDLLEATSEWTTRQVIESISKALEGVEEPALSLSLGLRLFLAKAEANPAWCLFVARVWTLGGLEFPGRDLHVGLRLGVFRVSDPAAARDVVFGGVREALLRIAAGEAGPDYGAQVAAVCLQALGTDARRIAAVLKHGLPTLASNGSTVEREVVR